MTGSTVESEAASINTTPSPEISIDLPPQVVSDVQEWLTRRLGAPIEQVKIIKIEQERWPDACLGLSQPDEACAAVITPGWRVALEVNGQEYEVRTNETGSIMRLRDSDGS